jgi:class 3 adenylate cyclase/tetratricopeptide (TPR) repeat protein
MRTVEHWLNELGLGKYAEVFAANDVDLRALPHLSEADLQELGVSLGHRRIIMAAIAEGRPVPAASPGPSAGKPGAAAPAAEGAAQKEADRRLLSVLFCDMVGSTRLAAALDPEDMHEVFRHYNDAVSAAVERYGGHVAKYLGDGVLAYFGWPMAYEDHAERAVHAGLAALAAVDGQTAPDGQQVRARVGIATGLVVVGDLSGGAVQDRGAIAGDTPNLAARLQAIAKAGEVVIGATTRRLAGDGFDIEDRGRKRLKGFKGTIQIYAVRGAREVESRFDSTRGRALSRFVGRANEIGILRERWELARNGRGQVVLVSGEAGIGKSRLVEALAEILGGPHELVRAQCSPYHGNSAYHPLIQRMMLLAGFSPDDGEAERIAKLERVVTAFGEDPDAVGAVYAELLSVDAKSRFKALELPAQQRKELTVRTLVNRVLHAAGRAPFVFIVEDVHWIDPSTSEVLQGIVSRIHDSPVLVVLTHRPDWTGDWALGQPHVTSLALGRLTREQIRALVASVLGAEVSEGLVERIAAASDGVPLFVEELARSIREGAPGGEPEGLHIPDSLQGSLMARLDRLPPAAKEVAQTAAVIGREFDRNLLGRVAGLDEEHLEEALGALLASQLVVTSALSPDRLVFRHALIQDTAYQSLLGRRRRRHHQAIADALAQLHPVADSQPELIARHLSEARQFERALPYWRRAGERAMERWANLEAAGHFERFLALVAKLDDAESRDRLEMTGCFALGEALFGAGNVARSIAMHERAMRLARRFGDAEILARCAMGIDHALFSANQPTLQTMALLREGIEGLPEDRDDLRSQLLSRIGRLHRMIGDIAKAREFDLAAIELARKVKDDMGLFDALTGRFLSPVALTKEDFAERDSVIDELLEIGERLGDSSCMARAIALDIWHSAEVGDRERMDRAIEINQEFGQKQDNVIFRWVLISSLAMRAILVGDFAGAESLSSDALELGQGALGDGAEGVHGTQMFSIRREQGRLAEVAPVIKRFIEENPGETAWLPGFALIAADLGFADPARKRLNEMAESGFNLPFDAKRSATLSYIAEVAVILGEAEHAERLYELMSVYEDMTVAAGVATVCYGAATRYLGMLAATFGDHDRAAGHFEHALAMNAAMGARPWLAHTQAQYARLLLKRGGNDAIKQANALTIQAWETAAELGMDRLKQLLRPNLH